MVVPAGQLCAAYNALFLTQAHQIMTMHACRGAVRLYADFYQSDIIVASPLALATALQEAETEGGPVACTQDCVMLSAIDLDAA